MKSRIYNTGAIGGYAPISGMSQQISKSDIRNNTGIDYDENNKSKVNYTDLIRQYMSPGKQQYKAYSSTPTKPVGISKAEINRMNMSHQNALAAEQQKYQQSQGEVGRLRPFEAQAMDYLGKYNNAAKNLGNVQQQLQQQQQQYQQLQKIPQVPSAFSDFSQNPRNWYALKSILNNYAGDPRGMTKDQYGNYTFAQDPGGHLKAVGINPLSMLNNINKYK